MTKLLAAIVTAVLTLTACLDSGSGDSLDNRCAKDGGALAYRTHGKSRTYYCIKGYKVLWIN